MLPGMSGFEFGILAILEFVSDFEIRISDFCKSRITHYAMQIQEMVCITCPLGCRMELAIEDGEIKAVQHNSCKRGIVYAQQEFHDPRRMVTATAAIAGGLVSRIPVRASAPLPIEQIPGVLQAVYALKLSAPLETGTPVITNIAGTGIDLIVTRNVKRET